MFGFMNYAWANEQLKQGKDVYVYRFTRKVPATGEYIKYGAFHTGEVPYAYDNLKFVDRPWEKADQNLADDYVRPIGQTSQEQATRMERDFRIGLLINQKIKK